MNPEVRELAGSGLVYNSPCLDSDVTIQNYERPQENYHEASRTFHCHSKASPAPLERLRDLAYNLRWSWSPDTVALFRRLDADLWESTGHNPCRMLGTIDQQQLEAAASDDAFLGHLGRVAHDLDEYLAARSSWFHRNYGGKVSPLIAYFSAEFGLTESLSIFAGGLGILAGDHPEIRQ